MKEGKRESVCVKNYSYKLSCGPKGMHEGQKFEEGVMDGKSFLMNDLSTNTLTVISTFLKLVLVAILPPNTLSVKDRDSHDSLLPGSPLCTTIK